MSDSHEAFNASEPIVEIASELGSELSALSELAQHTQVHFVDRWSEKDLVETVRNTPNIINTVTNAAAAIAVVTGEPAAAQRLTDVIEANIDNPFVADERDTLLAIQRGDFEAARSSTANPRLATKTYLAIRSGEKADYDEALLLLQEGTDAYRYRAIPVNRTPQMAVLMARAGYIDDARYLADFIDDSTLVAEPKAHILRSLAVERAKTGRIDESREITAGMATEYGGEPFFEGLFASEAGDEFRAVTLAQVAGISNQPEDWQAAARAVDLMEFNYTTRPDHSTFFQLLNDGAELPIEDRVAVALDAVKEMLGENVNIDQLAELDPHRDPALLKQVLKDIIEQIGAYDEGKDSGLLVGDVANIWLHVAALTRDPEVIELARAAVDKVDEECDGYNFEENLWVRFNLAALTREPQDITEAMSWIHYDYGHQVNHQQELQIRLANLLHETGRDEEAAEVAAAIDPEEYYDEEQLPITQVQLLRTAYETLQAGGLDASQHAAMIAVIRHTSQAILNRENIWNFVSNDLVFAANLLPLLGDLERFVPAEV